jgi:nitrogen-specific signal transduction histidine kinase
VKTNNGRDIKCALCGKIIIDQDPKSSLSIYTEVFDGTSLEFDTNECLNMYKRFRSVYGDEFKDLIEPQFVSDPFWDKAIPTGAEIKEIDIEMGIDKSDTIKVIQDPVEIQKIGLEIGRIVEDEILMLFSSANAYYRQEKLGSIQSLKELVVGRQAKARILTPKSKQIEESVNMLTRYPNIEVRYIEPGLQTQVSGLQTQVTILIVDRKTSIVVELKDDTKKTSYEAMGLGIFTNRISGVLPYVSMFESLWKQAELYEQVSKVYEKLKIHDRLQEEFINTAAHELRTPIQPILGLAEILRSKKNNITSTNVYDEYLSVIIRNARRLKELTDNILDIARIESKSITLNRKLVNLKSVIKDAVEDAVENQADPKLIKIQFDSNIRSGDNIILVSIDKGRIKQVISNLLSNALNFTKIGTISITIEKLKNRKSYVAIVSIKDSGSGIDPQIMPLLFTKFVTKSEKGTGLGLYICKKIIDAHGGEIWGKNNLDHGATFSFSLPIGDK